MKYGKLLAQAISTELFSGGGDPSVESLWFIKEMIEFVNKETNSDLPNLEDTYFSDETYARINSLINLLNSEKCNEIH
jgi:hypothetical protein